MNLPTLGRFVIPDVVATHFHFKAGDKVADFGAGAGNFLSALASIVGEDGKIIACEIQKALVEKLGANARTLGLSNVNPLWCDLEKADGIPLPRHHLDGAILVNTLFQFEDKATALKEIHRVLRPGAIFHVIDWSESFAGLGPTPAMVITKDEAVDLLETHGFQLEREYPAGDHHYGLAFRVI